MDTSTAGLVRSAFVAPLRLRPHHHAHHPRQQTHTDTSDAAGMACAAPTREGAGAEPVPTTYPRPTSQHLLVGRMCSERVQSPIEESARSP
jgi:hypothetical protein